MAKDAGHSVAKLAKIVLGLILVLVGIWSYIPWQWYNDLLVLIKGGIGIVIILIGMVFILIGWSD